MTITNGQIRCPLCDEPGYTTFAAIAGYGATCGTFWGPTTELRQSPACARISELQIELLLAKLGTVAA